MAKKANGAGRMSAGQAASTVVGGRFVAEATECRVFSAGPFTGTGMWKLARQRFDERMGQSPPALDAAPGEGCPDNPLAWHESKRTVPAGTAPVPGGARARRHPLPECRRRA